MTSRASARPHGPVRRSVRGRRSVALRSGGLARGQRPRLRRLRRQGRSSRWRLPLRRRPRRGRRAAAGRRAAQGRPRPRERSSGRDAQPQTPSVYGSTTQVGIQTLEVCSHRVHHSSRSCAPATSPVSTTSRRSGPGGLTLIRVARIGARSGYGCTRLAPRSAGCVRCRGSVVLGETQRVVPERRARLHERVGDRPSVALEDCARGMDQGNAGAHATGRGRGLAQEFGEREPMHLGAHPRWHGGSRRSTPSHRLIRVRESGVEFNDPGRQRPVRARAARRRRTVAPAPRGSGRSALCPTARGGSS